MVWRHDLPNCGMPRTSLVWPSNWGSARLHGDHSGEPGHDIVFFEFVLADLEFPRIGLDGLAHRLQAGLFEPGEVGAAIGGGHDVDEVLSFVS